MTEPEVPTAELGPFLLLYSEWLDVNGLMSSPKESGDRRTHAELVQDFMRGGGFSSRLRYHQ